MGTLAEILLGGLLVANVVLMDRSRRQVDRFGLGVLLGSNKRLADSIQRVNCISVALALVAVGLLILVVANSHGRELMLETQRDTAQFRLAVAASHHRLPWATENPAAAPRLIPSAASPASPGRPQGPVQLIIATALSDS